MTRSASVGRRTFILTILIPLAWWQVSSALAQDLPAITYTIAEGLPSDEVIRAVHDPAGFLWIGTSNALVRFDGQAFKVYGRDQGLDVGTGVNDIRLGANGHLWISTNGNGIFRFDLNAREPVAQLKRLEVGTGRASNRVNSFALTVDGELWAGSDAGLFVGSQESGDFRRIDLTLSPGRAQDSLQVTSIAARDSNLWVSSSDGIYHCRLGPSKSCTRVLTDAATMLLIDTQDRLWVAGDDGLKVWKIRDGALADGPTAFGGGSVLRITTAADGSVLAATRDGRALVINDDRAEVLFDTATQAPVMEILEDAARNVWLGTRRGLVCVRRQGVSVYSARHGLREPYIRAAFNDREGRQYALGEGHYLHRVEADRLLAVRLLVPPGVSRSVWLATALVDSHRDVWLGTARGLFRYSNIEFALDHTREYRPSAAYTSADGLAGDHVAAIFEDRRGNLWVSTVPTGPEALAVRAAGTNRFERFGTARGMPLFNQPVHFVEDNQGAVWAALREGGVVRIRDGRATVFGIDHGFPHLTGSLRDRNGHLWFGGAGALVRVLDPAADDARAVSITSRSIGRPNVIEQGQAGEILVGSDQGLFVVDERTGAAARYYSRFEGLPSGSVELLIKGPDHTLLLTSGRSLVRLDPTKRVRAPGPLRCVVSAVRLGGVSIPLPELGVDRLDGITLYPGRNHLEVEFVGLSPYVGEPLTYEYRLSEVAGDWQRTSDRRIAYTGLAAGRYRFEVRATGADGGSVSPAAALSFTILPPWYFRPWFLTLLAVALAALAYAAHRARLRQAVMAEQLRSRIATDLHDDLGASLSQIAVFSEVLRRRRDAMTPSETDGLLEKIGSTSRQLVSSMSDIVWAVNPRHDSLGDLVARMRWFAEDMFAQSDTELEFDAPSGVDHFRIGPMVKREMLLILKESVTNIVRHAHCQRAAVVLALDGRTLTLRVRDDGRGFDPEAVHQGNGIRSLRMRVSRLHGRLSIVSSPGRGTEVSLSVDIR